MAGIAQPNEASNALHEKFGFKKLGTFTSVGEKIRQILGCTVDGEAADLITRFLLQGQVSGELSWR